MVEKIKEDIVIHKYLWEDNNCDNFNTTINNEIKVYDFSMKY